MWKGLSQNRPEHMPVDIREADVAAAESEGQAIFFSNVMRDR